MRMRKFVTVVTVVTLVLILTMAVPIQAENKVKVADWHTTEFREMYARIVKSGSLEKLDPDVRKQIENYAIADRNQGESLLILRSIDWDVFVSKQKENEEAAIVKLLNLLLSKEFQVHTLLTELAKYDGIEARKDAKGIYHTYEIDIPPLPAEE